MVAPGMTYDMRPIARAVRTLEPDSEHRDKYIFRTSTMARSLKGSLGGGAPAIYLAVKVLCQPRAGKSTPHIFE